MNILTAHQPVYMPWLGLFHKIAISDTFVWFDDVQYQAKEWDNRNKIKTSHGPLWISIPVKRKNHFDIKLKNIEIDYSQNWQKKILKTIDLSYNKTKFYNKYKKFIEFFFSNNWKYLSEMNKYFILWVMKELRIKPKIIEMTKLKIDGKKSDLVLSMCKSVGCDVYVFGKEGKTYAEVEKFNKNKIKVFFQDYNHPSYSQLWGSFKSHMSILDLLLNCGDESYDILMSGNLSKNEIIKLINSRHEK